jgi:DNA-binding NtrC family response regulator
MRPPKKILLISQDEHRMSLLRYVLRNTRSGGPSSALYSVTSVDSTVGALKFLKESEYDLVLCQSPIASIKTLLNQMRDVFTWVPVLILTEKPPPEGKRYADHILYKPRMRTLLEKIKDTVTGCKGPKKGSPAAMKCGRNKRKPVVSESPVAQIEEDVA